MISDKNFIIPEYKMELQNRNKKIIKIIENTEQIKKNYITRNYKKNKFTRKKYMKRNKPKENYNYQPKVRENNFINKKSVGY